MRLGDMLVQVLVLEPMALEGGDGLFDHAESYHGPWYGLGAAMLPLRAGRINMTHKSLSAKCLPSGGCWCNPGTWSPWLR